MSLYNKHYKKSDYFGKPYPELMKYFDTFDRSKNILDLGCGQGRDALELGRMGFNVKGVDLSEVGINKLNEIAFIERISVIGVVADYKTFLEIFDYDFILMNSMFHFYKNYIVEETNAINRILDDMKVNARLVLVIQESTFRINLIKDIIKNSEHNLSIDYEESILYKEFNSPLFIISILKS